MKKGFALLICIALLFGCAAADQTVTLPESRYVIDVPDDMAYSAPENGDDGVQAYISGSMEMDYLSYSLEKAAALGLSANMQETVEKLAASGFDARLYGINGVEMIVYRMTDRSDGAPGIGYVFADRDRIIEVMFWYASQDAAELSQKIMETIRIAE